MTGAGVANPSGHPPGNPPPPSPEVLAAIVAAVEVAWPRPVVMSPPPGTERPGPWRFSGRWWSKPSAVQRNRPWVDRAS